MDETTQKGVHGAEAAHLLRYFSFQCSMGRASDEKSSHRTLLLEPSVFSSAFSCQYSISPL
jgi:hypothetical protein